MSQANLHCVPFHLSLELSLRTLLYRQVMDQGGMPIKHLKKLNIYRHDIADYLDIDILKKDKDPSDMRILKQSNLYFTTPLYSNSWATLLASQGINSILLTFISIFSNTRLYIKLWSVITKIRILSHA